MLVRATQGGRLALPPLGSDGLERSVSGIRLLVTDFLVKGGTGRSWSTAGRCCSTRHACVDGLERRLDFFEVCAAAPFGLQRSPKGRGLRRLAGVRSPL